MDSDNTRWVVSPCSWQAAARLSTELGIPQAVAMVLASRGLVEASAAREFLECSFDLPDPFLFDDMSSAVETVLSALDEGRRIVVHGDYDADGITATALLVLRLRAEGADVDWYLPSRFREGYGLSSAAVKAIAESGASVLITVDCGVNYPDEVAMARGLGLEVVVIDHHQPGSRLPECSLIHHSKSAYPHGELCGVGLALKFLHALCMRRHGDDSHRLPQVLMDTLDLVAVGTVADLAGLQGENRFYVREGLRSLSLGGRVGLRALAEVSGCAGAIDSGTVAFRLAPRLNAAGRLADPAEPLELLLTEDYEEAKVIASRLHELNGARQDIERGVLEAAQQRVETFERLPTALVLAGPEWHEGVVGIVASRLVERYQRPTVLLGIRDGVAKGSGRSIAGYDLLAGLSACSELLTIYGGHAQAAGLTLAAENVDAFRGALEEHAESLLSEADLVPTYRADSVLTATEINVETAQVLASLEPFGSGNPRPHFLLVDSVLQDVERTRNGSHMRCTANVGGVNIGAIGFGMGGDKLMPVEGELYALGAQLRADEWRGNLRAQLVLERLGRVAHTRGVGQSAESAPPARPREQVDPDLPCSSSGPEICTKAVQTQGEPASWPSAVRDRRDFPGRLTDTAQVLATGESVLMLVMRGEQTIRSLAERIPREVFDPPGVAQVLRADTAAPAQLAEAGVAIVEWGAEDLIAQAGREWNHVMLLDPPFRRCQKASALALQSAGSVVHLLYGKAERAATTGLLRYLVHPRFAMVCVYRAMERAGGCSEDILNMATQLALEEAGIALARSDTERARSLLAELGLEQTRAEGAKLDARQSPLYREAEAEYEECVRLCLTL